MLGCERTEYLEEESAESAESTQLSNPKENLSELSSLVELNSACRMSQTSLVAYDMKVKTLMFCDGNKWTTIDSTKSLANTKGTNTSKYKLLGELIDDGKTSSNKKNKRPSSFKCVASLGSNSFRCSSSKNSSIQLAH